MIFERNRMGISLTTVGEKIVNQAQIVLEEVDKIKAISASEKNTQQVESQNRFNILDSSIFVTFNNSISKKLIPRNNP